MKKILIIILALLTQTITNAKEQHLYLAAGDAIAVYDVATDSGKLRLVQTLALPGSGPFVFSDDSSRMYAMATKDKLAQMATLKRKGDGTLEIEHQAAINIRGGYMAVDRSGKFIAGNHYRDGKASVWALDNGVYRGTTAHEQVLEPKAHAAVFSPDNRWLLVPATGPNKVFVLHFDGTNGKLMPNDPPAGLAPDAETAARHPRHALFHPSLPTVVYTTNESMEPGVGVWRWDTDKGTLVPVQNVVTRPKGFEGRLSTSTLHLTKNERFLYISNRMKDGGSSIVGFRVDPKNGRLDLIGHTPCETVPRAFCLDQEGKYVYVAGQLDDKLGVYKIDQASGALSKVEQHEVGKRPMWIRTR